jgi:argininosuccinate lyase
MSGERSSMRKLWEKGNKIDREAMKFTVGKDYLYDSRLVKYDCLSSIAHAEMLYQINVLTLEEKEKIKAALNEIMRLKDLGEFQIEENDEDCHTKIENYLTEKLGSIGEKIHTARSRNDQVLTALRLYYKDEIKAIEGLTKELILSVKGFVKEYGRIKIPGFTHTRKAMPMSIKMWGKSFIESWNDDLKILKAVSDLIDASPLGTGAGFGIPVFDVKRKLTQKLLGFKRIQKNSLYVQNSRGKFEGAIVSALSLIRYDVNKMSSDIIFLSEDDIRIFEIPEAFTTGSSIMPHKRNPDLFEIARGNYVKIVSLEFELKMLPTNLISGYHRDLQLTKGAIMEAFDITKETIKIYSRVISNLKVNAKSAEKLLKDPQLFSVEKVNRLVKRGIPFREAYRIVAKDFVEK